MNSSSRSCIERLGEKKYVDAEFLRRNPDCVFVFGDNLERRGKGGAAAVRDEANTYGFITKKQPLNIGSAFYHPKEYWDVYRKEIQKLVAEVLDNPDKCYLISKLGAGLANRFNIFEEIIEVNLKKDLQDFHNVSFLW
ncbi:MAG: hypothetical protein ACFFEV_01615 [Candidatus Thorarchaeota archaeon]